MDKEKLKSLFNYYKEIELIESPNSLNLFDQELSSTTCLYEEEDGQNTRFRDLEFITYFFNLPSENSQLNKGIDKFLVEESRGNNEKKVRIKLDELIQEGKNINCIVRSTEEYGGDTHYSVWREYKKAEVYILGKIDLGT